MNRHFSPSEEIESFFFHNNFKDILCLIAFQLILREKEHPHAIIPLSADLNGKRFTDLSEKTVGYLKKDAHTVPGLSFCILSCPVLQVFYDLQRSRHCPMAPPAFNIYDGADPAVVMFKTFPVQSLLYLI